MKKTVLLVVSIIASLTLVIGSTLALLQSTSEENNTFTVGNAKIEIIELERDENGNLKEFSQDKPLYPAIELTNDAWQPVMAGTNPNSLHFADADANGLIDGIPSAAWCGMWDPAKVRGGEDKMVFVKNTGSVDVYYRTFIAFEDPDVTSNEAFIHANTNGSNLFSWERINDVLINGESYDVFVATYTARLTPSEVSRPSLLQVGLDMDVTNELIALCGDKIDILVFSEAVQAEGFTSATEALETAFGKVSDGYTPWN